MKQAVSPNQSAADQSAAGKTVGAAAPAQQHRFLIALYTVVVFLFWLSMYLFVPTLPMYAQSKGADLATVGVILSMYGLWQGLVRFPLGVVADGLGRRKPFIMAGICLSGLGAFLMGRATDVSHLIVGRAVTGLAAGAWVPMVAAYSALFAPNQAVQATAIVSMVSSLGQIVGTGATGTLNGIGGYRLAFFLAIGVAALAMLAILPVREVQRPRTHISFASVGRVIVRRDVWLPAVLGAVSQYAIWATTFGFLPILAKQLGASDVSQSLLTSLNLGLQVVGNLAVAAWSMRIGPAKLLYFSFACMAAGLGVAAAAQAPGYVVAAQVGLGLGMGVVFPVLMGMSIRNVGDGERTMAMGVFQSVYAIGMFSGPGLSGVLAHTIGIQPMFALTAALVLIAGIAGTRYLMLGQTR
jgi:DHA1 family multidrug resistance protein-like MFS transporter